MDEVTITFATELLIKWDFSEEVQLAFVSKTQVLPGDMEVLLRVSRVVGVAPVGAAPDYRLSTARRLYCTLAPLALPAYYFVTGLVEDDGDLRSAPGLDDVHTVLYRVTNLVYAVSGALLYAGSRRKMALMGSVLRSEVIARHQPAAASVAMLLASLFAVLAGLGVGFSMMRLPLQAVTAVIQTLLTNALEKLTVCLLMGCVRRHFLAINDSLLRMAGLASRRTSASPRTARTDMAHQVGAARAAHGRASVLVTRDVTRCFEALLLGVLLFDLAIVLVSAFMALDMLLNYNTVTFTFVFGVNAVANLATAYLMVRACCLASREAARTKHCIFHVLNQRSVSDGEMHQLTLFYHQMLHNDVSVSPFGVTKVDYTLLSTTLLAVVTYIIILGQFSMSFPEHVVAALNVSTTPVDPSTVRPPRR